MSISTPSMRYAIVTGGANGLGREFCLRLAHDRWQIAIVDVDRAGAEETLRLVAAAGGVAHVEVCDVTAIDQWLALHNRLQAAWPRLDLLINNAGMYAAGNVGSLDLKAAEQLIQLNVNGVLYGCHTFVPWLIATASSPAEANQPLTAPCIINIASSFAFLCAPGMAPYNLSKAAVVALSETLHGELKPHGVGVTVVCPGPMPTRFVESASFESPAFRQLSELYLRKSQLNPATVAAAALHARDRKQLYVVMGSDQRWYWRIKRLLPNTLLSRVARRVRKDLKTIRVRESRSDP